MRSSPCRRSDRHTIAQPRRVISTPPLALFLFQVPLGAPYLKAGAMHLGKACEAQNNEFMLCRSDKTKHWLKEFVKLEKMMPKSRPFPWTGWK